MTTRKVTVFSTVGSKKVIVETEATIWRELKKDLDAKGIAYNGMRAIIGENQLTLESDGAKLPIGLSVGDSITNDFTLFLSAKKIKSGGVKKSDLVNRIKKDVEQLARLQDNVKSKSRSKPRKKVSNEIRTLSKQAKEIEDSITE